MKICSVCKIEKRSEDFYVRDRVRGRLHAQCKACYAVKRKAFANEHYSKYGDQYRARARQRKAKLKKLRQEQLFKYLQDKRCESCGFSDIRVLDFDHIDASTKNSV